MEVYQIFLTLYAFIGAIYGFLFAVRLGHHNSTLWTDLKWFMKHHYDEEIANVMAYVMIGACIGIPYMLGSSLYHHFRDMFIAKPRN